MPWPPRIQRALAESKVVLVLIGPQWLENDQVTGAPRVFNEDDWVRLEIRTALNAQARGVSVIPILVRGANMPRDNLLPPDIRGLASLDPLRIRDQRTSYTSEDIQELISKIDELLPGLTRRVLLQRVAIIAGTTVVAASGVGAITIAVKQSLPPHSLTPRRYPLPTQAPNEIDAATVIGIINPPAIAAGQIYVTATDGKLYALSVADGTVLTVQWPSTLQPQIKTKPVVCEVGKRRICATTSDGYVYAFTEARDGQFRPSWRSAYPIPFTLDTCVASFDNLLLATSSDGHLYAFDLANEQPNPKWIGDTGASAELEPAELSPPTVADKRIFVASDDGHVYAFDAAGTLLWPTPDNPWRVPPSINASRYSAPAADTGVVYFGSAQGILTALDANTGSYLWSVQAGYGPLYSPVVTDGYVYVTSDDAVHAVDILQKRERWNFPTNVGIQRSVAVLRGVVFVGSQAGELDGLDATSGQIAPFLGWFGFTKTPLFENQFAEHLSLNGPATGAPLTSPVAASGRLYVGSSAGVIYTLEL